MITKTHEQILADLEQSFYCPGAKDCIVADCQHAVPHARMDHCEDGCFDGVTCISLAESRRVR